MTPEQIRAAFVRLGLSQSGFARLLKALGDPAEPSTILRRVQRWCTGEAKVPGEAVALIAVLERTGFRPSADPACPLGQEREAG